MTTKFIVLTKDWVRHGLYSGYERLMNHVSFPIIYAKKLNLPYRFVSCFAKRTQLINYKSTTVIKELLILIQIFKKKKIHILYGDMDYYYLHYLKQFPFNLRDNKLIATFHHPPSELEKRLQYNRSKVLSALDKIIVMGPNQISFLEQYTDADFKFIPHGINTDYFKYNVDKERLNQILLIGVSHRDHKRNIEIIEGVNRVIDTHFIIVITEDFSELYRNIKNVTIVTNNISDAQLLKYYQESKGLLLSLKDCTASNSILEALSCGCPLIVNDVGAVTDYIPRESGIPVFDNLDIEGTIDYVVKLLSNKDYLRNISELQRNLAEKYDWKHIAKTTEEFILS